jgi:hypothetical protein
MVRKNLMLAFVVFGGIALVATMGSVVAGPAAAKSTGSPQHLVATGWSCPLLLGLVHCLPPGTSVKNGGSPSLTALVFDTTDSNSSDAPFLGTEHVIRADVFEKGGVSQPPCPQDPPTFEYRDLRTTDLGIPYYACHHYDSGF